MNKKYPFDPNIKHHLLIALVFAIWTFIFLFFTEPLEISVYNQHQKIVYLPLFAVFAAISYLIVLPLQKRIFQKNKQQWFIYNELIILGILTQKSNLSVYISVRRPALRY